MNKYLLLFFMIFAKIELKNDPTMPPTLKKMSNVQLQLNLECILIMNDKKECIMNNQLLKAGDTINDFTITEIEADFVKIKNNSSGQEISLYLDDLSWIESLSKEET